MDDRERMEKLDLLRNRFKVSYAEASAALDASGWDVVAAAVRLEGRSAGSPRGVMEELKVTGSELVDTIKRLLHQGNINRIIVRNEDGQELLNLPVNGLLAVTALIPILTAIGAAVVLAMDYTVLVERRA